MGMKKLLLSLFTLGTIIVCAQPGKKGKDAHMEPVLEQGYYLTAKGDSVKGEIQTNRENDGMFYKSVLFKAKGVPKVTELTPKKVRGYGFGDHHFTVYKKGEEEVYIRYVEKGRMNLMEYQEAKTEEGVEKFPSTYYIQDTKAAGDDTHGTKDLTEIPQKPPGHKKMLKIFLKDQPIIVDGVDKWYFKIDEIQKAVHEFNKLYE